MRRRLQDSHSAAPEQGRQHGGESKGLSLDGSILGRSPPAGCCCLGFMLRVLVFIRVKWRVGMGSVQSSLEGLGLSLPVRLSQFKASVWCCDLWCACLRSPQGYNSGNDGAQADSTSFAEPLHSLQSCSVHMSVFTLAGSVTALV